VQRIYGQLELDYTVEFDGRLKRYVEGLVGYKKNQFSPLADDQQRVIFRAMYPYYERWGYAPDGSRASAEQSDAA